MTAAYADSVFLNCPFDDDYRPLFRTIVFTIHDAGFVARCALEISDASRDRLTRIESIIERCRYGIHDISRTEVGGSGLPRFNMPFELGLFMGSKRYGGRKQRRTAWCWIVNDTGTSASSRTSRGATSHPTREGPSGRSAGFATGSGRPRSEPRSPVERASGRGTSGSSKTFRRSAERLASMRRTCLSLTTRTWSWNGSARMLVDMHSSAP